MVYFFFHCCIFFPAPWEWVSEWNVNFSCEKKKYTKLLEKKIHLQISKIFENCLIYRFSPFFADIFFSSEWLSNFSWEKKIQLVFFLWKKKIKILPNRVSEWGTNFSGEKKYNTFGKSFLFCYHDGTIQF